MSGKDIKYTIKTDRAGAIANVVFGIIFILWTVIDVWVGFFEEYWYANVFLGLIGVLFLIHGLFSLKAIRKLECDLRSEGTSKEDDWKSDS